MQAVPDPAAPALGSTGFQPSPAQRLSLLNAWQRGFPLCDEPFAVVGAALDLSAAQVLQAYRQLAREGALSRIGAVFAPGSGGASILSAMAVPPERLEAVAAVVSAHPGVNHNYERENAYNLWFVVTGPSAAQVECTIASLEADTGLTALRLPMLQPYRIDLAFDLSSELTTGPQHAAQVGSCALQPPLVAPRAQLSCADFLFLSWFFALAMAASICCFSALVSFLFVDNMIYLLVEFILSFQNCIEIIRPILSLFRTEETYSHDVTDYLFKRLSVLFVHSQKHERQKDNNHDE